MTDTEDFLFMIRLEVKNLGKRFNREWIFRHMDQVFHAPGKYAITGSNGSGKSTLLQVLAGSTEKSEGSLWLNDKEMDAGAYAQVSLAAPYLELIEEMTALEALEFHSQFKTFVKANSEILQHVNLSAAARKQIRYFSSGMKQRLKLAQAFFSDTDILFLDEPTTNLDAEGSELYQQLINDYTQNRLVIISSNDQQEYACCTEIIKMAAFKPASVNL